jgi:hypothetical protein
VRIDYEQHDREEAGEDRGPYGLERREQLVDAADRDQDVRGNAREQRIPLRRNS